MLKNSVYGSQQNIESLVLVHFDLVTCAARLTIRRAGEAVTAKMNANTNNSINHNFFADLQAAFLLAQDQDCFVLQNGSALSYSQVASLVGGIAEALIDSGVVIGDRVVVQVEKSPQCMATYLACLAVGAIYVPLNTAYTESEIRYFLADAQPRLFITDPKNLSVYESLVDTTPALLSLSADGSGTLMDRVPRSASPVQSIAQCQPDDLAVIVYTSGTTGRSKGAMLTHENLRSNALSLIECWGWRDDDVLLHALPIFHVHGLFIAAHCALLRGTSMVFLPKFDPTVVRSWLPKCTVMMGVPTFYTRLLGQVDFGNAECANIRLFISGSAPLTEQTFVSWQARTGQEILERYGMSETIVNTSNPLVGDRVAGTVGFALPGVEVRITDSVGKSLPSGEVGNIEVRGNNVFCGYWQMPEKTAEEFRADGFFITGDMGVLDEFARLSIVGREKDLVISGGYNVYPKEVEKLLDEMSDVVESAVIGVPHEDFGEAVVAVIVADNPNLTLVDIEQALAGQLARFKQPKKLIQVAELPRNSMGKVQKNLLRQEHADLFKTTS